MNVTLAEYLNGVSIWSSIQALSPYPFFSTNPPEQLDAQTVFTYGDKLTFSKVVNKSVDEMAVNIVALYGDSWAKLIEIQALEFNIGSNLTKKTTENITKTEARNNTREEINKVSAFNTDDLINNEGSNVVSDDDLTGDSERVLIEENINLNAAFDNLNLLQKSNIIATVIKDVASYLTLDVY